MLMYLWGVAMTNSDDGARTGVRIAEWTMVEIGFYVYSPARFLYTQKVLEEELAPACFVGKRGDVSLHLNRKKRQCSKVNG